MKPLFIGNTMQKTLSKKELHERESAYDYWKDRPMFERPAALEELRRQ